MEDKSECKECKTWEEKMYWTHFNSFHFFITLPPHFHDHIVLPEKFASHMKLQFPDKVSLKAPSGVLWEIDVLKSDNILFVGNKWMDFVKANNVKENNLLMFKCDRNSSFEVLIFDQESSCEIEGSYFLTNCRLSRAAHGNQKMKTTREASSTELIEDYNEEDDLFVESKKSSKDDIPGASTELIEDDNEKDDVFVVSKKSSKDDRPGVCSSSEANTECPMKGVLDDEEEDDVFVKSKKSTKDDRPGACSSLEANTECPLKPVLDDNDEDDAFVKSKKSTKYDRLGVCSSLEANTEFPMNRVLDDNEENGVIVKSKKSKRDDRPAACSSLKRNTEGPMKSVLDNYEEDDVFVKSKKSRKDVGPGACSSLKMNTKCPMKRVLQAAAEGREVPRKLGSQSKPAVQTKKKRFQKEAIKKLKQISQVDVITAEGESLPKKDHSLKLKAQYTKSLDKRASPVGLSHSKRDLITSDCSESFHKLRGQCENQPTIDDTEIESCPISNRALMNIDIEDNFQAIAHSHQSEDQSEKIPSMNKNSKEPSQNLGKDMITHENADDSPITDCSHRVEGQVDKEQSASGTIKEAADGRKCYPEKDHAEKSGSRRKEGLHESLKKLVFKNVSGQKKCPSEKISNRRLVTEEEKEGALQRATHKKTKNSFTAVMRPTSVNRRFFLNITSKWCYKHNLHRNQDVILRVGNKSWLTTYTNYGKGLGLYHGWKRFSLDNNLEESDVLVFTPVSQKVGAVIVMDVDIFRVV